MAHRVVQTSTLLSHNNIYLTCAFPDTAATLTQAKELPVGIYKVPVLVKDLQGEGDAQEATVRICRCRNNQCLASQRSSALGVGGILTLLFGLALLLLLCKYTTHSDKQMYNTQNKLTYLQAFKSESAHTHSLEESVHFAFGFHSMSVAQAISALCICDSCAVPLSQASWQLVFVRRERTSWSLMTPSAGVEACF